MNESAKEKIIVALDVPDAAEAGRVMDDMAGLAAWVKIGMQLFTSEGPGIVAAARGRGFRVFLDLKFHDIPNTVASGVRSARELGVEMLTIHLSGGPEMVARALGAAGDETLLLGVTVLTSSSRETLAAVGTPHEPRDLVLRLARMGLENGIRGIVCSPLELGGIRAEFGDRLKTVTPGVRPAGSDHGDQKRVMTPGDAVKAGADWLVIGRPIVGAADRRHGFVRIADEIENALKPRMDTDAHG
jgi:orotidine-5'-phosphate decarboxylase